jgi:SnoaL-like domain
MEQATSFERQVRWLVDRAEITELLARYARCIDARDWAGLQDTYAEDGVMEHGATAVGRDQVPDLSERILRGVASSHHLIGDPSIEIDGDAARTR